MEREFRDMEKKKKVVLVGPVYPYKGGIAHYTSLMYRALCQKYDVEMVSYKKQYPKLLFRKEQKDYSNDFFKVENTKYWIRTANIFSCIVSAIKIKKMAPNLVIFQWWHPYFAPCYWIMSKILAKTEKMFLCHNVLPHERFPFDRHLVKMILKQGDSYIVHSKLDEADLKELKSNALITRTVHPTYNIFNINNMEAKQARELLVIPPQKKVMLFFGFVREYKGLKHLIKALPQVKKSLDDILLLVVGDFGTDKEEYLMLIKSLNVEAEIKIVDGYVPDTEVEKYFACSDVVVLPYESATQSGIVQIAYGFQKPVISTNVGGLSEVVEDNKTGLLIPARDEKALAEAIIKFFKENKAEIFSQGIKEEEYKYSWEHLAEIVALHHGKNRNEV
jgi:Glycosyltransferase